MIDKVFREIISHVQRIAPDTLKITIETSEEDINNVSKQMISELEGSISYIGEIKDDMRFTSYSMPTYRKETGLGQLIIKFEKCN